MFRHPELDPDYRWHVAGLLAWVKDSFGQARRYGATSIREQTGCFFEMSSHTARYASVAAKWFGVTRDPRDREEARSSFALATYSAYSKYSHQDNSVNYVGIGYVNPWFIDSYFDYLSHILEGMAELPEMAAADADHITGSRPFARGPGSEALPVSIPGYRVSKEGSSPVTASPSSG